MSLDQPAPGAPALARLVAEAEVGEAPPDDDIPLYAPRREIYPQSVHGRFRNIKWAVLVVTLGIYYLLPFVRWDRGPNAPSQAVLIDFPNRRFYFFFIEIWPQEIYYLTGLLILAAIVLFLMNAVAGRIWCGYLCPQTVWTDLFFAIERFVEGDRREHMQRDSRKWTVETYARKGVKHFLWLMVAWWTGGAWVLYFADAPTLVKDLATGEAPFLAYAWIGILTVTTYSLAGHMREQVCLYMCPWPRIQAALTDEYALNVTYRYDRGEPRCSAKKAEQLRAQQQPAGDCVDCLQCVHVCPTGVDIRGGANLGCIQCGLCIDACDAVMSKLGRATGLIAYDTDLNIKQRIGGQAGLLQDRAHAHRALCGDNRGGRRHHDLHACHPRQRRHQRHPRPQSDVCAAVRRRAAQRLHHSHRQQTAQIPRLHCQRRRPAVDAGGFRRLAAACRRASVDLRRPRPDQGSARRRDRLQQPRRRRPRPPSCSN